MVRHVEAVGMTSMTLPLIQEKVAEGFIVINENDPVAVRDWLTQALTDVMEAGGEEQVHNYERDFDAWIRKWKAEGAKEREREIENDIKKITIHPETENLEGMAEIYRKIWNETFLPKVLSYITSTSKGEGV